MLKNRFIVSFGISFIYTAIAYSVCKSTLSVLIACVVFFGLIIFLFMRPPYRKCAVIMLSAAVVSIVWQSVYFSLSSLPRELLEKNSFEAVLEASSYGRETEGDKYSFRARIKCGKHEPQVLVYADEIGETVRPGDIIRAQVSVGELNSVGFPSRETYYRSRNISALVYASDAEIISRAERIPPRYIPCCIAETIRNKIESIYDADTAGFLRSLILGDRDGISGEFYNNLRKTGMVHVISVSGLHISLIVGILLCFLRRKNLRLLIIPVIFLFAFSVGTPQSALRAAIMQSMLIIAPLVKREYDQLTALFTAGVVLVAVNPYCATDVAFLLSFFATLGIVLFSNRIYLAAISRMRIGNRVLRRIVSGICKAAAVSISAQIFTLPILCYNYASISSIAAVSNVILGLPMTAAFVMGIVITMLGFIFPRTAALAGKSIALIRSFIVAVSDRLAALPFAELYTGGLPCFLIICYISIAVALLIAFGKEYIRRKIIGFSAIALVGAVLVMSCLACNTKCCGKMRFGVLDVGQGECVIAKLRDKCVMVDCGGSKDACREARIYMLRYGISKIDALILTHMHDDHTNGVKDLLDCTAVDKIYVPETDRGSMELSGIPERVDKKDIIYVNEDVNLKFGGIDVNILAFPQDEYDSGSDDENENGMAVVLGTGGYKTLITGDLPMEYEWEILNAVPDCNAYIVGHHGASTSSSIAFLDRILPEIAVISVGKDNGYGHPDDGTLSRLSNIGSCIYRTDLDGTVTFVSE